MKALNLIDPFEDLYVADLYCGGGGTIQGLLELCAEWKIRMHGLAINHWDTAIATHSANHPYLEHLCMNVDQVNPRDVWKWRRMDILIASPECTHHSVARGGKPINDQSRASAWTVLKWIEVWQPKYVLVENVPEFQTWGRLYKSGPNKDRPIQKFKGEIFLDFLHAIEHHGYKVNRKVLNAADYGAATTRKRLFMMCRRGARQLDFPEPTHAPEATADMFGSRQKWRAAREIIDWSIEGESIFNRKRPLSPNTMRRIYAGLEKFSGGTFVMGKGVVQPFIVNLRGTAEHQLDGSATSIETPVPGLTGENHVYVAAPVQSFILNIRGGNDGYMRGESVEKPAQVITGHPAMALVEPQAFVLGQQSQGRPRSVSQPIPSPTTDGAIAMVQPLLVAMDHTGGNGLPVRPVSQGVSTITSKARHGLMEPVLLAYHGGKNGSKRAHSIKKPLPTADTSNRYGVAEPYLVKYNGTGANIHGVDQPLPTQTSKERFALCVPSMGGAIIDIFFRMLTWRELASAMGFPEDYVFAGTKEKKVKQIGNAVEKHQAKALFRQILQDHFPKHNLPQ